MSKLGGYLLVDFEGKDISTSKTISGIYNKVKETKKRVVACNLKVGTTVFKELTLDVKKVGTDYVLTNSVIKVVIRSDNSVVALAFTDDNSSNKKIYYHPILIDDDNTTFTLTFAILDNNPLAYTKDEMLIKLKALLDDGALIQVNGWFINSGEMHNAFIITKSGGDYRLLGNCEDISTKFRYEPLNNIWESIVTFSDGVNAIN